MSRLEILPLRFEGEISPGDDLAGLLLAAAPPLSDGDVVVVSHKAVSQGGGSGRRPGDGRALRRGRWSWRATAATRGTPSWCCARAARIVRRRGRS